MLWCNIIYVVTTQKKKSFIDVTLVILLRKYNLELYMTATELKESTESGVWGGKSISVFSVLSVVESYKKHIRFSITSILIRNIKQNDMPHNDLSQLQPVPACFVSI